MGLKVDQRYTEPLKISALKALSIIYKLFDVCVTKELSSTLLLGYYCIYF